MIGVHEMPFFLIGPLSSAKKQGFMRTQISQTQVGGWYLARGKIGGYLQMAYTKTLKGDFFRKIGLNQTTYLLLTALCVYTPLL